MVSKAILFQPQGRSSTAGTRLALVPIANRPIAAHALDTLDRAGVRQVMVVCAPEEAEQLREAVSGQSEPELHWLVHDRPGDLAASLAGARDFIAGEPFVVHLGDSLCRESLLPLIQSQGIGEADALALVQEPGGGQAEVVSLRGNPLGCADPAGLYAVGPGVVDAVNATPPLPGIEEGLLATLGVLAQRGGRLDTPAVRSWWRYRGRADALLEANRFLLQGLRADAAAATLVDSHIQGEVAIDPSAKLDSTTVRGPAIIGPRVRLVNAYVGPYTSIGADVVIEGAEIEHSIILPGASIAHLGGRLEASIVGAQAKVFRDFRLPRALRLNVGEGAEISLA
jgi:glucose-1-phosphate thymidylyltransferase